MAPFRWPEIKYDLALAKEVASSMPKKPAEWDAVAARLSAAFSMDDKVVEIKGRGCRERMERLIEKYRKEDAKALKRSGTEEEYTDLAQLCEDILTYTRDMNEIINKEKESKKRREEEDRRKAEEMKNAAMEGLAKRRHSSGASGHSSSDENSKSDCDGSTCSSVDSSTKGPKRKIQHRVSKKTAMEMLANKYTQKAELKEKELEIRMLELEFQRKKYEAEAEERKVKLELEMEERKAMLALLKDKF